MKVESGQARHMDTLSRLLIPPYCDGDQAQKQLERVRADLQYLCALDGFEWKKFLELADSNHVLMRALAVLEAAALAYGEPKMAEACSVALAAEQARIEHAAGFLDRICRALESNGCAVAVIKSLDHWPDLGSDLDVYTTADPRRVQEVMRREFNACWVARSWGDRLAGKWNFKVPGLPELVEIHVQRLGQTGEHQRMARRIIERRLRRAIGDHEFYVPAPEERLVISALQRVYRHFYFRLCDMIDVARLLRTETVDFSELRAATSAAGIWPGVATFLCLVRSYIGAYGGSIVLPLEVVTSAQRAQSRVRFKQSFLRMSPVSAAGLYGSQLLQAGLRRDLRTLARLPLLPPLAVSALVAERLTGNNKGIW
jgi:Uncharacterised nucleotidyltransferase